MSSENRRFRPSTSAANHAKWLKRCQPASARFSHTVRSSHRWLWTSTITLSGLIVVGFLLLASCATEPPRNVNNACAIFAQQDHWYQNAKAASQRWGVPVPVLMAIMHQESAFRADAKPPRSWYLGFIPGPRPSSAFGYSQALDGTWERYMAETGKDGADRDEFADAVDFIGWYMDQTTRYNRIPKTDAYNHYLAYHEGQGGFAKGTHQKKAWLMQRARQVRQQADRYRAQLLRCKPD